MTDLGFGAEAPANEPAVGGADRHPESRGADGQPRLGRTVASGILWSSVGRFGAMGFGLVANAAIAHLLVPREFGSYMLAMSSVGTFAMVAQMALPQTTVRAVAAANSRGEGGARSALLSAATTSSVLAAVAFVALALGLGRLVLQVFPDADLTPYTTVLSLLVALRMLDNVTPELFRGVRDFKDASVFAGLLATVLLAVTAIVLDGAVGRTSLRTVLWLTVGASAVSLALAGLRLRRQFVRLPPVPSGRARLLDLSLVSPTLWIATVVSYVITQMDLWVVGALGDAQEVALYGAAFRLSMLIMVPASIANFVVPPLVVEMLNRREPRRLESLVQTVAAVAGAPALALVLLFALFGQQLTELLYGPFYEGAGAAVAILALGKVLNVLTGACGITLIMAGGQRQNLAVMAGNLVLTLPLQVAGFHLWGIEGLAAATAVGVGLQNLALLWVVARLVGVRTHANPFRVRSVVREHGGITALLRELSSRDRRRR